MSAKVDAAYAAYLRAQARWTDDTSDSAAYAAYLSAAQAWSDACAMADPNNAISALRLARQEA